MSDDYLDGAGNELAAYERARQITASTLNAKTAEAARARLGLSNPAEQAAAQLVQDAKPSRKQPSDLEAMRTRLAQLEEERDALEREVWAAEAAVDESALPGSSVDNTGGEDDA